MRMKVGRVALLLGLAVGCGTSDERDCECGEATIASLPEPIDSSGGVLLIVAWADGSATCEVTGVAAECDSNGALDSEAEEQVLEFAVEVMNLGGSSQVGEVLPEIERVRVPGKQSQIVVTLEEADVSYAISGELTKDSGTSSCGVCDYWAATLVRE